MGAFAEEDGIDLHAMKELLAKQQIHEVLVRYCRGIDRGDSDLVRSAFHPDAVQNQRGNDVPVSDLFDRLARPARQVMQSACHYMGNELVEVEGDVANCESYFIACHRLQHDGASWDWIVGGRYVDRFERRSGLWKITNRVAVYDWVRVDRVGDPPADLEVIKGINEGFWGQRAPDDVSYRR
jgi:hypothetical protein